ncbi:MAG: hypothetical protein ACP5DC_00845 [Halothiobacillaceae bacterium]
MTALPEREQKLVEQQRQAPLAESADLPLNIAAKRNPVEDLPPNAAIRIESSDRIVPAGDQTPASEADPAPNDQPLVEAQTKSATSSEPDVADRQSEDAAPNSEHAQREADEPSEDETVESQAGSKPAPISSEDEAPEQDAAPITEPAQGEENSAERPVTPEPEATGTGEQPEVAADNESSMEAIEAQAGDTGVAVGRKSRQMQAVRRSRMAREPGEAPSPTRAPRSRSRGVGTQREED